MVLKVPGTKWEPLGAQTQPPMIAHDIFCGHTMVGNLTGTSSMFHENGYGGTESNIGIGGIWGADKGLGLDGFSEQWQDLMFSADANLEGSRRVISVETADNAVRPIKPWTAKQLAELIRIGIIVCSHDFHKNCPSTWKCRQGVMWKNIRVAIPPVMIPDTRSDRRGLAVHRQGVLHYEGLGVAGYLQPGCEKWSKAKGKDCPTDVRVRQWETIVVPGIQQGLLEKEQADMPLSPADIATIRTIVREEAPTADEVVDALVRRRFQTYYPELDAEGKPKLDADGKIIWQTRSGGHLLGQAAEIHEIAGIAKAIREHDAVEDRQHEAVTGQISQVLDEILEGRTPPADPT